MAIVTKAQLKAYLGKDTTAEGTPTDGGDTFLDELIARAQKYVENRLGTAIEQATVTAEYHDCAMIIVPDMRPFDSNLVVKYRADYSSSASDVTLTNYTDYIAYSTHIVLYKYIHLTGSEGRLRIKLAYTGGYASGSYPAPLQDAVIKTAAYMLRLNDPIAPNTAVDTRIPSDVEETILPYKRLRTP